MSSDDDKIITVAKEYGCEVPFRRPDALAEDDTPSMDTLLHALDQAEPYDYVVLLQPTSPLRTADDIDATIARCYETDVPACVTVDETDRPPQWMYMLGEGNRLVPVMDRDEEITQRQDAPPTYVLNGAVYVARSAWLRETESFLSGQTRANEMPAVRAADADDELGLA